MIRPWPACAALFGAPGAPRPPVPGSPAILHGAARRLAL